MTNNTATPYTDITQGISAELAKLRTEMPDTLRGFSAMAKGATQDGALDKKTKELIAIALSVAMRCDPCIGFHAQPAPGSGRPSAPPPLPLRHRHRRLPDVPLLGAPRRPCGVRPPGLDCPLEINLHEDAPAHPLRHRLAGHGLQRPRCLGH